MVAIPESLNYRLARDDDTVEMARLAEVLGYPVTTDTMRERLAALLPDERHRIIVADDAGRLRGWIHVEHRMSLGGGSRAELMGLVVDPASRGAGIGAALVAQAEAWATTRGILIITVRSNTAREISHPFYESLGYTRVKTQHAYEKALG